MLQHHLVNATHCNTIHTVAVGVAGIIVCFTFSALFTVSFRVYDIGNTGSIDRSEIKQFLVALIQDNPDLALDEAAVDSIIDQVRFFTAPSVWAWG